MQSITGKEGRGRMPEGPSASAVTTASICFTGPSIRKRSTQRAPRQSPNCSKSLASALGSVGVGVADLGPDPLKWLSTDDFTGKPLKFKPEEHRYALVFLQKEELVRPPLQTGMSMATVHYQAKVARGYFLDDYIAGHLAQFIRALGYHAVAHNNGYARSIPLAILAGLGELGRHGNLIALKFGPNARISTVTTDIPLAPDHPVDIGVQSTCANCTRCYDYCPGNSVAIEKSNFIGIYKYMINTWRLCQSSQAGLEAETLNSETCTICRDVCPYAKPPNFANIMGRTIASRSYFSRKMMLKLDDLLYSRWDKYGMQVTSLPRQDCG